MHPTKYKIWIVILLVNVIAIWCVAADWSSPIRGLIIFGYLTIFPGLVFIDLLPFQDLTTRIVLIIIISLGINTLISEIFLYLDSWLPIAMLLTIVTICLLGVIVDFGLEIEKYKKE